MKFFVLTKKSGPFLGPFCSKNWPFSPKNHVFGHFLRNRTSKFGQKLGTGALNHLMLVCVQENFYFGCFANFCVKNALLVVILYMVSYCFWSLRTSCFWQLNGANSELDLSQSRETTALRACFHFFSQRLCKSIQKKHKKLFILESPCWGIWQPEEKK